MEGQWRYAITLPDCEAIRREVWAEPYLEIGDTETYYAYIQRMEYVAERARELRFWAFDQVIRGPMRSVPLTTIRTPPRPAHYTLDPFGASTSGAVRSPVRLPITPTGPSHLSPRPYQSPFYTPGQYQTPRYSFSPVVTPTSPSRPEYSTWGYTGIAPDTDSEDLAGISVGSGYRVGGLSEGASRVEAGVGSEAVVAEVETELARGSAGVAAEVVSGGVSSEVQVWVPESPVVEVLVISSAEDLAEGVELVEEEPIEDETEMMTETSTTRGSTDDPDYTGGS